MSENNSSCYSQVGGYLAAFSIGALLGAGLAVIFAPCSGKETRDALARRTGELKDKAGSVAESVVTGAKELFRNKKADLAAAVEAGKEAMQVE